jgi:hypothetical protein
LAAQISPPFADVMRLKARIHISKRRFFHVLKDFNFTGASGDFQGIVKKHELIQTSRKFFACFGHGRAATGRHDRIGAHTHLWDKPHILY